MTEIPIEPKLFWSLFYFICYLLAAGLIYTLLSTSKRRGDDPLDRLKGKFGASVTSDGIFFFALLLWAAVFLSLFYGLVSIIWEIIQNSTTIPDGDYSDPRFVFLRLTALTATMGATVALPFTLIRLRLTSEQTQTATDSLFNDKINAATENLNAMRQRWDGKQNIWEDDIPHRNAAIDRLEVLAKDQPDSASRISRLLSVYVRELSREHPPIKPLDGTTPEELIDWARTLTVQRSDVQNAVQVLGRLQGILSDKPDAITIDLRGANLQGFDLINLDFTNANFESANLERTTIGKSNFHGARFRYAKFLRTVFSNLDGTTETIFSGDLFAAIFKHCNFSNFTFKDDELHATSISNCVFSYCSFESSWSYFEQLSDSELHHCAIRNTVIAEETDFDLENVFGDASVQILNGMDRPAHWPTSKLNDKEFNAKWAQWRHRSLRSERLQDIQTANAAE